MILLATVNLSAQKKVAEITVTRYNGVKIHATTYTFKDEGQDCYSLTVSRCGVRLVSQENLSLEEVNSEEWEFIFLHRGCEGDSKYFLSLKRGKLRVRDNLEGKAINKVLTGIKPRT